MNQILDAKIKKAFELRAQREFQNKDLTGEEAITFTPEFETRMEKLLVRREQSRPWTPYRIGRLAAILILAVGLTYGATATLHSYFKEKGPVLPGDNIPSPSEQIGLEKPGSGDYQYAGYCVASMEVIDGIAYCYADSSGPEVTNIEATVTLQKKELFGWNEEAAWQCSKSGSAANFVQTAPVTTGTYRVKAVFTVYSDSASESITVYSAEKKV